MGPHKWPSSSVGCNIEIGLITKYDPKNKILSTLICTEYFIMSYRKCLLIYTLIELSSTSNGKNKRNIYTLDSEGAHGSHSQCCEQSARTSLHLPLLYVRITSVKPVGSKTTWVEISGMCQCCAWAIEHRT